MDSSQKVNREIKHVFVQLVMPDGNMYGKVKTSEALAIAEEMGLDLIEVSASSNPPICKISDYGKIKYDRSKKKKNSHKGEHVIKEIRVGFNTSSHDLKIKNRKIEEFLKKRFRVKYTMEIKGRQKINEESIVNKIKENISEFSSIASWDEPSLNGRFASVMIVPY